MKPEEQFAELWNDYLEGELDEAGLERLRKLLAEHPALRLRAVDLFQTHRLLGFVRQSDAEPVDAFTRTVLARLPMPREVFIASVGGRLQRNRDRRAGPWFRWTQLWRYAAVAATAVALTGAAWFRWVERPAAAEATVPAVAARDTIATLLFASDCRWDSPTAPPLEGQRLAPGRWQLAQGLAVVRFDGGAAAIASAGADFELLSRGAARLRAGRVTVRAAEEAAGFTLHTPGREVVDLGTEFAVNVEPTGATEVHVLDGEVETYPTDRSGTAARWKQGQAVRFDQADAPQGRPVAVNAPRFDALLLQASPGGQRRSLLAYEGFEYRPGQVSLAEAHGGSGWTGPWRLRTAAEAAREIVRDTTLDLSIRAEPLSAPWPLVAARGGVLEMPAGEQVRLRSLATPVDLGQDAVYYFSVLVAEDPREARHGAQDPMDGQRLTFRASEDYWRSSVGLAIPPALRPQIYASQTEVFTSAARLTAGVPYFCAVKIAASRDGEDEIFLRVYSPNETPDSIEPLDWTVSSRGFRSDARLDVVLVTGTGRGRHWFDELRIGNSWESVVPLREQPAALNQGRYAQEPGMANYRHPSRSFGGALPYQD